MKKLRAFLCTMICVLGLTACGETSRLDEIKQENTKQYIATLQGENGPAASVISFMSTISEESYYAWSSYSNKEIESLFSGTVDGHGFKTVMESFHLAKDSVGEVIEAANYQCEVSGKTIIVTADAKCSKNNADAKIELIFSNDMFLKLEGGSINPVSTGSELMKKAALNTVIGMGTVFAVLILISIIIACFGLIPKIQAAFAKKEKKTNTTGIENAVAQITKQEAVLEAADDTELVAVIAAAVAAYEGSANTDGFVVRSIRRR